MKVSALYAAPILAVAGVVMLAVLGSLELGHRLGRLAPTCEKQVTTISSTVLALIGLLLAFSFSLAEGRVALRWEATVREANSIGTFWMRTELLPASLSAQMRTRLRRYVDLHFEHRAARNGQAQVAALEAEATRLQQELWALLMAEAHRSPDERSLLLTVPALNAMIDDAAGALAAEENRLPEAMLVFLFALIVLGGFAVGYASRRERRNWLLWCAFAVVLGGVLVVLLDLDRPRRGWIQATMDPYVRLRASLQGD